MASHPGRMKREAKPWLTVWLMRCQPVPPITLHSALSSDEVESQHSMQ